MGQSESKMVRKPYNEKEEKGQLKKAYNEILKDPEGISLYRNMLKKLKERLKELKRARCRDYWTKWSKTKTDMEIDGELNRIQRGEGGSCLWEAHKLIRNGFHRGPGLPNYSGITLPRPSEEEIELEKQIDKFTFYDKFNLLKAYNHYNSISNGETMYPRTSQKYIKSTNYNILPLHYKKMFNTSKYFTTTDSQPGQGSYDVTYYQKIQGGKSKKRSNSKRSKTHKKRRS
jgi:hypothetical protein